MSVMFTCSGLFESSRMNCVSVVSLAGIRLSMAISIGLISCECARSLSITKHRSPVSILNAGISLSMTMGMSASRYL